LYNEKAFNHIAVLALIWHAAAKQLFPKQFAQFYEKYGWQHGKISFAGI